MVVFYPGDGTPVCTAQLVSYTDEIAAFAEVGATVLAMSPQSVESHRAFAAENGGFAFPLLADEDRAVGEAYGIIGPLGFYRRAVFVVGADGRVSWIHRAVAGLTFQPTDGDRGCHPRRVRRRDRAAVTRSSCARHGTTDFRHGSGLVNALAVRELVPSESCVTHCLWCMI